MFSAHTLPFTDAINMGLQDVCSAEVKVVYARSEDSLCFVRKYKHFSMMERLLDARSENAKRV